MDIIHLFATDDKEEYIYLLQGRNLFDKSTRKESVCYINNDSAHLFATDNKDRVFLFATVNKDRVHLFVTVSKDRIYQLSTVSKDRVHQIATVQSTTRTVHLFTTVNKTESICLLITQTPSVCY